MLSLIERNVDAISQRLVLLAPPQATVPSFFGNTTTDPQRHRALIREMQQLRGGIYLQDGAVQPHHLSPDGLHQTTEDDLSWHLLMLDKDQRVSACIWYLQHETTPTSIHHLRVKSCALAHEEGWRDKLRFAVDSELAQARHDRVAYSEVGGWAVSEQNRCTPEGLLLILATFGLSRVFGGALGLSTATVRHSSATILRRLGLSRLEVGGTPVAPYYDAKYECEMELLRYDTRKSSPKYHAIIERLKMRLENVPVFATSAQTMTVTATETAA